MTRVSATDARKSFFDTISRVAYTGERFVVARHGKDVAALVPIDDLAVLKALEDRYDLDAVKEAMKEHGTVSWEKVKADLGL
jgi:prevent-host-death family protein